MTSWERPRPIPTLRGLCYDSRTVFAYRDAGKLLCMRLDLSYKCNLKCRYCYAGRLVQEHKAEASYDEVIGVVRQGIALGAKSVVLLGGEPLAYPHLFGLLHMLRQHDVTPVVFTNGSLLTPRIAQELHDCSASVLVKFDGFDETQDILCGPGYASRREAGLACLREHWDTSSGDALTLGYASVVTNVNYHEIEHIWRYCRTNNVFPHVERMTVGHEQMRVLAISNRQARRLNEELRRIDETEFGILWDAPYPAIPGLNCSIFYVGCHIDPYLGVSLCPELEALDSAKGKPLEEILAGEMFRRARSIDSHIEGKCSTCVHLKHTGCYGCRSKAYRSTGSVFGEYTDCPVVGCQESEGRRGSEAD